MPFLVTNSHLATKPYNLDIKCQSNSESYDQYVFFILSLVGVRIFLLIVGSFFNKREYSEANWLVPLLDHYSEHFKVAMGGVNFCGSLGYLTGGTN